MRKNYYLKDVVTKAKCFGYTNIEIMEAVKEGIKAYDYLTKSIKSSKKKEE